MMTDNNYVLAAELLLHKIGSIDADLYFEVRDNIADALKSMRRVALNDACMAACWYCERGIQLHKIEAESEDEWDEYYHIENEKMPGCNAEDIRDLLDKMDN